MALHAPDVVISKPVALKMTRISSDVTSTLWKTSKHGSPVEVELRHLRRYFLSIYNKYPLNVDIWSYSTAFKFGKKIAGHKNTKNAFKAIDYGSQAYNTYANFKQGRGFEDDEDVFGRDLDAEEFFERDYDVLDERDIIDDLD
jgi:hypothetical protein